MKLSTLIPAFLVFLVFQTFGPALVRADSSSADPEEIRLTKGLALGPVGQYRRSAAFSDPFWHRLATDTLEGPEEGGVVISAGTDRERAWTSIEADEKGWFQNKTLRGGWLYIPVRSDRKEVMILEATGHSLVLVNGEPRGGDVYSYGWVQHPVLLNKGTNNLFFRVSRGKVRARLVTAEREIFLTARDILLPDVIAGETRPVWG